MVHRARVALVTTLGVAALCYAGLARWTFADEAQQPLVTNPPPIDAAPPPSAIAAAVAAGRHVRIEGPHGAIHVWIPPGFHSDVGATIIYLHGYYDDSDSSYIGHRLPEQFAMSALDAMFIVAETPVAQKTPINYPSLGELLQLVEDKTGTPRGMAYTAVVGHSGAFRTIDAWLDEPLVDELVMIDSMYGNEEQIEAWMRASPRHRLVTVGEDTLIYNESLLRALPDTPSCSPACRRRTRRGPPRRTPRDPFTSARSSCTCRSSPTASCCPACCACCPFRCSPTSRGRLLSGTVYTNETYVA